MSHISTLFLSACTLFLAGCNFSSLESSVERDPTTLHPSTIIQLSTPTLIHSPKISQASDLAYNDETNTLYVIGDKGLLYSYEVSFEKDKLILQYQETKDISKINPSFKIDSEGLTINAMHDMIISFEGTPRISNIDTNGSIGKTYTLPEVLNKKSNYVDGNKMLESVAWHETYGVLTAAEFPLKDKNNTQQTIYSLNGKVWHFKAEPYTDNAVTAIEVMDDNNLLILERAYKKGSIPSFYITLKKLYLNECDDHQLCKTDILYAQKIDFKNYEGLTKIGENHYLMVNDNQDKVSTEFFYFKIE